MNCAPWSEQGDRRPGAVAQLTGDQAGETTFKTGAQGKRVLHLATHGFFLGSDCPSAIPGVRGFGKLAAASEESQADPDSDGPQPVLRGGYASSHSLPASDYERAVLLASRPDPATACCSIQTVRSITVPVVSVQMIWLFPFWARKRIAAVPCRLSTNLWHRSNCPIGMI